MDAQNAQDSAKQVADQVQQTASKVSAEAQKAAENVQHTVAEASRNMRESAYAVKETASNSLLSAAENLRREAVKSGNEDAIRQAHRLARNMEKTAVYLDSHTFDQIGDVAAERIKENPWQSLTIAFVIGLILGLLASSGRD